jgi:hypothetical protein
MKTRAFLFADSASVREGLLNVLGAGITRLVRDPLPSRLDAVLAIMLQADDLDDLQATHSLEVFVTESSPDGPVVVAKAVLDLVGRAGPTAAESAFPVPVVVPIQAVPIPRTGSYQITAKIDGQQIGTQYFEVVKAPDSASASAQP